MPPASAPGGGGGGGGGAPSPDIPGWGGGGGGGIIKPPSELAGGGGGGAMGADIWAMEVPGGGGGGGGAAPGRYSIVQETIDKRIIAAIFHLTLGQGRFQRSPYSSGHARCAGGIRGWSHLCHPMVDLW